MVYCRSNNLCRKWVFIHLVLILLVLLGQKSKKREECRGNERRPIVALVLRPQSIDGISQIR